MPTIEIVNTTKTDSTISAEYTFTDDDNVGSIDSVKLYKGDTLIATNQKKQIAFANLGSHTEYEIVIAYSYDLNDGKGVQNETFKESCTTSPYLQFDSCKIINTSAVSEGETIYMQATLNNPAHALPSSVVVNGQTYNCTGSTDANKIYVEIVNDGQFEGGNTTLFIEKINMTLDGEIYTLTIDSNNSGTVFINGTLSIVSAEFVNKDGVAVVDYCTPDDGVYVLLTLKNKTGYVIDSVTVDYDEVAALTKIDDEHYKIEKTLSDGWNRCAIKSVTYHNTYLNKTLNVGDECETSRIYKTNSSAVTEISTVKQLMSTEYNGGYYKLTADIDLSGMEWTNLGTFDGVFDGNGHKILNMSNVSTVISKDIYIGLFKEGSGILINLEIKDMTVMLTLTGNVCNAYCGGVLARTSTDIKPGNAVFKNCTVTGDISVNNMTGGTADAGGIVGHVNGSQYLYIDSCNVNMNISLKNGDKNIGYAAGLCGGVLMQISDMRVYNCRISGSITAFDVAAINVYVPFPEDNVHYENNTCDVYLNGVRKTILEDFHSDAEQENTD